MNYAVPVNLPLCRMTEQGHDHINVWIADKINVFDFRLAFFAEHSLAAMIRFLSSLQVCSLKSQA